MKARSALPLLALVLFACSSSSNTAAPGNPVDAGTTFDASVGDGSTAPVLSSYEQAVASTTWAKLAAGPSVGSGEKMDDIFFISNLVGWAASGPGEGIFKTTDGGMTWNKVFTHAGTYFRAVLFLDDMHGFAGNLGAGLTGSISDATVLYETKDGGMTWNPVTTISGPLASVDGGAPIPSGICNLTQIDATHLVAVGRANGPAYMIMSSDAGATWTSIDINTQLSMAIDARFTSPTEGIVAGMNAGTLPGSPTSCTIIHTADAGKTWDTVFTSKTTNSLCWKLSFPTADAGFVAVQDSAGGPPTYAKTSDGGKTWAEMPLPVKKDSTGGYPAIGIGFITPNVGWVSPEDPTLPTYRTTDGGTTWAVDAALKSPINRFRFVDKNTAYAIGGATWKLDIAYTGN